MKKLVLMIILILTLIFACNCIVYATEDSTDIPELEFEQWMLMMQSKQGKVDIIKKNNVSIEELKAELKIDIVEAAQKINDLKINISQDKVDISDDTFEELRELLQFLQDSKNTLENDVETISSEIDSILDLISTKGMDLLQYDEIISRQNEVIVKMKSLLETINKI